MIPLLDLVLGLGHSKPAPTETPKRAAYRRECYPARILELLRERPNLNVTEINDALDGVYRSTTSSVSRLRNRGAIVSDSRGRCRLAKPGETSAGRLYAPDRVLLALREHGPLRRRELLEHTDAKPRTLDTALYQLRVEGKIILRKPYYEVATADHGRVAGPGTRGVALQPEPA